MKKFAALFALLISAFCLIDAKATSFDLRALSSNNGGFLPVEEAYRLNIVVEQDVLFLDWTIAPGYYLYQDKFRVTAITADKSQPLKIQLEEGPVIFDEYEGKEVGVFYQKTRVTAAIKDLPQTFLLSVRSQGCAEAGLCYAPHTQTFEINRQFGTAVETAPPASSTPFSGGGSNTTYEATSLADVGKYILFALIGGLILNLMPCVFPILSLKALSFASSSGDTNQNALHGWSYTFGVVSSFAVVAGILIAAKEAGELSGWGFQLQSPTFVALLAYLFWVMGLSLSGFVYFGGRFMGLGQSLTTQGGLKGSFFTGVLAAVVTSPCSGPFMATALGFALTQPSTIAMVIFLSLGLGMALPFLLLSYSPQLANLLPKPGPWMEKFKQFLAFPMYATAAWLIYVFGGQVGVAGVFFLLIGALALVMAIWFFQNVPQRSTWKFVVQCLGITCLVCAGGIAWKGSDFQTNNDDWKPFSEELVEDLRRKGQPVLVDFTAAWCLTCKANEAVALSREEFREVVKQYNVALVKADWTNEDPLISKALAQHNRSGVPLYLVYPADLSEPPEILPQLLTQDIVIQAIKRAAGASDLASTP